MCLFMSDQPIDGPKTPNLGPAAPSGSRMLVGYPAVFREGIDPDVIAALQDLDKLLAEGRDGTEFSFAVTDEASALRSYLLYTTVLVDVVLSAIASAAINSMDLLVIMLQRLMVEYAAKVAYYADHPEHALYAMTIGNAKRILSQLQEAGESAERITEAMRHRELLRSQFSRVDHLRSLRMPEIMRPYAGPADYIGLYAMPSGLLHGDPVGLQFILRSDDRGQLLASFEKSTDEINARLVDAGADAHVVYDQFVSHFFPENQQLACASKALRSRLEKLAVRHHWGRKTLP